MIKLGSNIASLSAQRRLAETSTALSKAFERLSSGMRINSAGDDAAGLSVATKLSADTHVYTQAIRNVNDGVSALNVAEGALQELTNVSIRQRELAEQAANGTYSLKQRRAMNTEANALVDEFNRIISTTDFNGLGLLDSSIDTLSIQAGYGTDGQISFNLDGALERNVWDGTFASRAVYTPGSRPSAMTCGDFNGDGKLDLVSTDENSASSSLFLGNGDGTFQARSLISVNRSYGVRSTDLNHDGKLDLVMSQQVVNPGTVVLLGNGDGTFCAQRLINTGSGSSFGFEDFDHNGAIDIVSTDTTNGVAQLNLGNGDGTFKAAATLNVFGVASDMGTAVGDVNGDGQSDIVIGTSTGVGRTVILLSNGDGTFQGPTSLGKLYGGDRRAVTIADINGDGVNDILAGSSGSGQLITYIGNGNGSFRQNTYLNCYITPLSFTPGDFNGDGIVDLALVDVNTNAMDILVGNGDGTFKAAVSQATGVHPLGLTTGDFNGDGVSDFANADYTDNAVGVLIANTRGVSTTPYLNICTRSGALNAMSTIDATLQRISAELGAIGSTQSRFSVALNVLGAIRENYTAAFGRIMDADIAEESANMMRTQILQQAGAAVLAQANQQPALAIQLLRG